MLVVNQTRTARSLGLQRATLTRLVDAHAAPDIDPLLWHRRPSPFLQDEWGLTFGERLRVLARTSPKSEPALAPRPALVPVPTHAVAILNPSGSWFKSTSTSVSLLRPAPLPPFALSSPALPVPAVLQLVPPQPSPPLRILDKVVQAPLLIATPVERSSKKRKRGVNATVVAPPPESGPSIVTPDVLVVAAQPVPLTDGQDRMAVPSLSEQAATAVQHALLDDVRLGNLTTGIPDQVAQAPPVERASTERKRGLPAVQAAPDVLAAPVVLADQTARPGVVLEPKAAKRRRGKGPAALQDNDEAHTTAEPIVLLDAPVPASAAPTTKKAKRRDRTLDIGVLVTPDAEPHVEDVAPETKKAKRQHQKAAASLETEDLTPARRESTNLVPAALLDHAATGSNKVERQRQAVAAAFQRDDAASAVVAATSATRAAPEDYAEAAPTATGGKKAKRQRQKTVSESQNGVLAAPADVDAPAIQPAVLVLAAAKEKRRDRKARVDDAVLAAPAQVDATAVVPPIQEAQPHVSPNAKRGRRKAKDVAATEATPDVITASAQADVSPTVAPQPANANRQRKEAGADTVAKAPRPGPSAPRAKAPIDEQAAALALQGMARPFAYMSLDEVREQPPSTWSWSRHKDFDVPTDFAEADVDVATDSELELHRTSLDLVEREVAASVEPRHPMPPFNQGNAALQSAAVFRERFLQDVDAGKARQAVQRTHQLLFRKEFVRHPERAEFFGPAVGILLAHGEYASASELHAWMESEGFLTPPTLLAQLVIAALRSAASDEELALCKRILEDVRPHLPEAIFASALARLAAPENRQSTATLDTLVRKYTAGRREGWAPGRGIVCVMINALARDGDRAGAERWLQRYRDTARPRTQGPYSALMAAHVRAQDSAAALRVLEAMSADDVTPPVAVYNMLLSQRPAPHEPRSAGVERAFRVARIMPPAVWAVADAFTFGSLWKAHERWRADVITRTGPPTPPPRALFRAMLARARTRVGPRLLAIALRVLMVRGDYAGALVALDAPHDAEGAERARTAVVGALWRRMRGEVSAQGAAAARAEALETDVTDRGGVFEPRRARDVRALARWTDHMLAEPGGLRRRGAWLRAYAARGESISGIDGVFEWLVGDGVEVPGDDDVEPLRVLLRRAILASCDVSVLAPEEVQLSVLRPAVEKARLEMLPNTRVGAWS